MEPDPEEESISGLPTSGLSVRLSHVFSVKKDKESIQRNTSVSMGVIYTTR